MTDLDKHVAIFAEVHAERVRQDAKWGPQHHPIRRNSEAAFFKYEVDTAKRTCDRYMAEGHMTWYDAAHEEFCEVFAESTPERQREELIQLIAVCVHMVENIDEEVEKKKGASDEVQR
jgi:hypothetical protein